MATKTETVTMNQGDVLEAIKEWLYKNYPRNSDDGVWTVELKVVKVPRGLGMSEYDTDNFSATATRKA